MAWDGAGTMAILRFRATFGATFQGKTGPWPLWSLFLLDVASTSLLLRCARAHKALVDSTSTSRCANFLFSALVSAQLFFVNIVFFDPGMHFLYVNQVFYAPRSRASEPKGLDLHDSAAKSVDLCGFMWF